MVGLKNFLGEFFEIDVKQLDRTERNEFDHSIVKKIADKSKKNELLSIFYFRTLLFFGRRSLEAYFYIYSMFEKWEGFN